MIKMNGWTALVAVSSIFAVCAMAYFKVDPKAIAAVASALIGVAAAFEKLFPGPPGPPATPAAIAASALFLAIACTPLEAKQAAAGATYESETDKCVDDFADREDIDKCRRNVRIRWHVEQPQMVLLDAGTDASTRDAGALDSGKDSSP